MVETSISIIKKLR